MRKAGRIVVIVGAIIGWIVLVSQDPSTIRLDSMLPVDDARFVDYVAALTSSPTTTGDRYDMLVNGDRSFPAMLDAIRSATRRVNLIPTPSRSHGRAARTTSTCCARGWKSTSISRR